MQSIESTLEYLKKFGEKGKIIAGGTDLLIGIKNMKYLPEKLIDITSIPDLNKIDFNEGKGIIIGANSVHADICQNDKIIENYTALAEACSELGSPQVRNVATIGGNICNAAPSAETAPALIALNCKVRTVGPSGVKKINVEEFFKGPSENVLEKNEFVTQLEIEEMPSRSGSSYIRLSPRNALDIAIVNVGVFVKLDDEFKFEEVRICLGAVAPTPVRALNAEKALSGETMSEKLLKEAGNLAKLNAKPISDVRSSAVYRKEMAAVLTERALFKAYERAKKSY